MAVNILVFGSSIVYGAWDFDGGGWVARLRRFLEERALNTDEEGDVLVYNLGISGDTTSGVLSRFEFEIKNRIDQRAETIIIFAIGLNDSQFRHEENQHKVALLNFENNIQQLIELARKHTSRIVFLGLTAVDEKRTDPLEWDPIKSYKNEYVQKYNSALKKICAEQGVDYIEVPKLNENLLEDGLHPNSEGHKIIFEAVKKHILSHWIIKLLFKGW